MVVPGSKSGATLVGPQRGRELNPEASVDPAHPGVIDPGNPEGDGPLRLQKLVD